MALVGKQRIISTEKNDWYLPLRRAAAKRGADEQ